MCEQPQPPGSEICFISKHGKRVPCVEHGSTYRKRISMVWKKRPICILYFYTLTINSLETKTCTFHVHDKTSSIPVHEAFGNILHLYSKFHTKLGSKPMQHAPGEVVFHLCFVHDHVDYPGNHFRVSAANLHKRHTQLFEFLQRHLMEKQNKIIKTRVIASKLS